RCLCARYPRPYPGAMTGRAVHAGLAVDRADPVDDPADAGPGVGAGPALPVIGDRDAQPAARGLAGDRDPACPRVLDGVADRLGDHVVGGQLRSLAEPARWQPDVDGEGVLLGHAPDRLLQADLVQHPRVNPVREVAESLDDL